MSTLKTTNLQHASATSPAIVLASDSSATATLSSLNGGPLAGARNRIINGDMRIDQRNGGASVTPLASTEAYCVDRWKGNQTLSSKYSIQQNAGAVTPPTGFSNYVGVTSLSAYSVLSTDTFTLLQSIEGFNTADFNFGTANAATVMLSFWVRSSLTGTFGGSLCNSASNRSYAFSYSINSSNTWEYKTVSIPGDTTGTWLTNNGVGISVRFGLGSGSNYTGTVNAWNASNAIQPSGSVSVVGTNGATFFITGVQLEPGSVATPYERRSYGAELALAQRYFCKTFPTATAPAQNAGSQGSIGFIAQTTTAQTDINWRFPVEMRASPTVITYSPNAASSNWSTNGDTPTASIIYNAASGLAVRASASAAVGRGYSIHITADAEL